MRMFVALFLSACLINVSAADLNDLPSHRFGLGPNSDLPVYELFPIDAEAFRELERRNTEPGPLRVANPIDVIESPWDAGTWEQVNADMWVWRMHIYSPGATDLNFGFGRYNLPEKAELYISSEAYGEVRGPYTKADNQLHGEFWTPMVPGDRATIELLVHERYRKDVDLVLTRISQGFQDFLGVHETAHRQGSCNNDVVCPEGDPWRDQIRSVGAYTVGGTDTCTGTLVMDAVSSFRNYFLTANHCGLGTGNAASMVVYWNFESPNCGDLSGGTRDQFTSGATFRAARADVDMALVELNSSPDPAYNVYYAGWDRSGNVPTGSVGIHHPGVDEKAISFNDDPLGTTPSCIGSNTPDTHWEVDDWEDGTTEPGSSGSALFDPDNKLVIGFLSGGQASCSNISYDCYGKVSVAWDGASETSRLRDWLDPNNSGVMTVQGSNPAASVSFVSATGTDFCGGVADDGVWEPGETIELTVSVTGNEAIAGITGLLTSNDPNVAISNGALTFPNVTASGEVVNSVAPATIQLAPGITCFSEVSFQLQLDSDVTDPVMASFSRQIGAQPGIDLPVALADNDVTEIQIPITEDITITDLNVLLQINHTYVGDLSVSLMSPGGTTVRLLDRAGGTGCSDNDMDILFDDSAAMQLGDHCEGTSPWYQGDAQPLDVLSVFNGQSTLGTWTLIVNDQAGQDTGQLVGFELRPTPGFEGNCDLCNSDCSGELSVDIGSDISVCADQPFTLDALVTGAGEGSLTYSWEPAGIFNDATIASPTGQVSETTMVTLTVQDSEGCFTSASITVTPMMMMSDMAAIWTNHGQANNSSDPNGDNQIDMRDLTLSLNEGCVSQE